MPELPEVETIVRELSETVRGRKILSVRVRLNKLVPTGPRRLAQLLKGAVVNEIQRRGKYIDFCLSDGKHLVVHLKMTGQFLWSNGSATWPKHVHMALDFEEGDSLWYRDIRQFGRIRGFLPEEYDKWLQEQTLGPDPFQIEGREFAKILKRRTGRIKPLLLNQGFISGLGNIYTDEALFAAGIHPLCSAESISEDQACRLHEKICAILEEAIHLRGSTTSNYVGLRGVGGSYQERHQAYGRGGEACNICGEEMKRIVVAGRGTHFCPCCQPE